MRKKLLTVILLLGFILVNFGLSSAFAAYKDIPSNASYKQAVEKLNKLGILVYKDYFKPNTAILRGEFAAAIVKISNAEDEANLQKGYSQYPDIKPNTVLCGYVNWAVKKKYMTPMADGKFNPNSPLTFAQATTAIIRMLRYSDSDLSGIWPQNYIDKASELGLIKGINLSASQKVPRWAAALMLSRLLDTEVKSGGNQAQSGQSALSGVSASSQNSSGTKFSEYVGLYKSYVVLDTGKTSSKLLSNEVLTDNGVLVNTTKTQLEVGKKYMLQVDSNKITKVFGTEADSFQIVSTKVSSKTVYYKESGKTKSITLPSSATYYYNGSKQSYDAIENVLKPNQKISFIYSEDRSKVDYIVIKDIYAQEVYGNYDEVLILATPKTSSSLEANQVQTDKGIYFVASSIKPENLEIGAKYGVYIKDDTITTALQKVWVSDKFTIKNIDDYTLDVQQNGKTQKIQLSSKPLYYYQGTKQNYDSLSNVLKEDQILYVSKDPDTGKVMAYVIQDPYGTQYGNYIEAIILQDALLNPALENNQVLTDKGIFYLPNINTKLEIGSKYGVYVKDDKITLVVKKLNTVNLYEITDVVSDTNVKLKSSKGQENIILPQKPVYYYNGNKISYSDLKNALKSGQKIYFGYSKDGKTCEYIVLQDPYSSEYGAYTEVIVLADAVVSDKLSTNEVLTDKGIYAVKSTAGKLIVGAKYGVYIKNDTITKVVKKLNSVDTAEVTEVISDTNVVLKKGSTSSSTFLPQKPVYYYNGSKVDYNSLKNIIKSGQKIYFGYNAAGNSYEYAIIQDPYYDSYGKYVETVILGTYSTTKGLDVDEILTDQGILTLPENQNVNLDLGSKYGLYIDNDNQITLVYKKLNSTEGVTVLSAISNKVTVDKGGSQVDMILPQNITYYYNGSKIDFSTALSKLQMSTSLVFGLSNKKKGYDYCVIFDPVYSKPYIAGDQTYMTLKIGDLDISGSKKFIKDGDVVDYSYIQKYNVVYEVKDIWGKNSYILIVDNKIDCYLKSYQPTRFTPKSIVVSVYDLASGKLVEKTYDISENCDTSWILSDTFKTGQRVYILLGYDGKVVAMVNP
ncbi:S-layer domain-containing protein [Caldicellulosiruptor kronotskyensis 2002]|uniref:S-layer domain-containing protein n=1 Tax=Caldicellulosiruptor kronotskyensis (strain DSM 18902 / VKM B-2412 / 2002) TaxID=632348 RepID=E4SDV6_CALK2|nr:S-layer homology domain-containing protein [Caldicellulosiruptor kronotskyensis]ADQ45243.1 S-layer domain-containing protein [Caldicellulosiruptor kronotskyensis 2002]